MSGDPGAGEEGGVRETNEATVLPGPEDPRTRRRRLFKIAARVAVAISVLITLPDIGFWLWNTFWLVQPWWLRAVLRPVFGFVCLAVLAVPLTLRPRRIGPLSVPDALWARTDRASDWALRGGLDRVLLWAAVVLLAGWLPHYLLWPWWSDTEYFAVVAQAWDHGILPYRDLYDFNFPGPTYVHWLLGKVFGWGHTLPFNLLDAALVVGLGVLLTAWSRDRFGRATPGLFGYMAFLGYYLSLNYALVGQRDWHAAGLAVLALATLEMRRDRAGLVVSALAFAAALTVRPHPVVFLPALLSAIDEHAREAGDPWWKTLRAGAVWSCVVAAGLVAGAAPVVLAGVADDFAYWFRVAWYGGEYNRATPQSLPWRVLAELGRWEIGATFVALGVFAVSGPGPRRTARTWALALAGAYLYRPLSPFPHDYLRHPLILTWSVGLAVLAARLLTCDRLAPVVRLLLLALVMSYPISWVPNFWRPVASARALVDIFRHGEPVVPPPGCEGALGNRKDYGVYPWEDYRAVLAYLRTHTGPRTYVANFFRSHPFPTVNAPTGRLPAFPSPAGILWLRHAAPGLEAEFVDALERPRDVVVVWSPNVSPSRRALGLESLERSIRRNYVPEATFGNIEVWRRKAADATPARADGTGSQPGGNATPDSAPPGPAAAPH